MQLKYLLFIPLFFALVSFNAFAQLTGTKNIPGDYATIQAAIAALNSQGVIAPGVTFNVAAGHTETFTTPTAGTITTTTSAVGSPILFQKSGAGNNPKITAFQWISATTYDGMIKIAGGDYITFDGIDLQENPLNATFYTDWGYAIVKESAANGSQNITIKNCVVTLNKLNTNSVGIYGGNHTATDNLTLLTIASASGTNASVKINNCNVSNCYNPISISGSSSSTYYDTGLEIGTTQANTVSNFGGGSSATSGIYVTGQNAPKIEKNSITSGTGTGDVYGINVAAACDENLIINNNTVSVITGAGSPIYGMSITGGTTINIYNNTVSNITGGSGTLYGLYTANRNDRYIYGNQIFNLDGLGTVYGLWLNWDFPYTNIGEVYKNNIYDLSSSSTTGPVIGIRIVTGTVYVYNNFISDLRMPSANASEPITGIYVSGGNSTSLFFNTIYLSAASSGTDFGSNGIYADVNIPVDMRNNIIVNLSKPKGTGKTVAYRRSGSSLSNHSANSNNNCFYAGPPRPNKLICLAGTTSYQTIEQFQLALGGTKESASFTENVPFVNPPLNNLHVSTTVPTLTQAGGIAVALPIVITTDYDGNLRNATTPDVGADEFAGTPNTDPFPPVISYTPLDADNNTSSRNFTNVSITDNLVDWSNAPRVYYKRSTDNNAFVGNTNTDNGWKWKSANTSTSPTNFTIDYSLLYDGTGVSDGDIIQYFVVAQDISSLPNVGINLGSFEEQPSSVNLAAANFPVEGTNSYFILGGTIGGVIISVGTSETYTSLTVDSPQGLFKMLNPKTLTGNVTIQITSDLVETGEVELAVPNTLGFSITFKPVNAVEKIISGDYPAGGLIRLNGADNITIDGRFGGSGNYLTFKNTNNSLDNAAIQLMSYGTIPGAKNNTIRNCKIQAGHNGETTFGIAVGGYGLGSAGSDNDNLSFIDNVIVGGYYGVAVFGSSTINNNINIIGNTIGSSLPSEYIGRFGIYIQQADDVDIIGNNIFNIISSYPGNLYGIYISAGVKDAIISENKINSINFTGTEGGAAGIAISTSSTLIDANILVKNNLIYDISGDGHNYVTNLADNVFGIFLSSIQRGIKIYNNSIHLYGNTLNQVNAISAGIGIGAGGGYGNTAEIKNNIIVNTLGRFGGDGYGRVGIFIKEFDIQSSDNNLIYVNPSSGLGVKLIGQFDIYGYTTLQDWRDNMDLDFYSFSGDPAFTSNTNLMPDNNNANCWAVNNKGMPLALVPTDFTGAARSTTVAGGPVDIGVYEFSTSTIPPVAIQGGTIGDGLITTYNVFEFESDSIKWHGSGLPSNISFRYYSGIEPPAANNNTSKCYWDITQTGGSSFTYDITFTYDPAQLGAITSENDIRLAKSNDNGVSWLYFNTVGSGANQYKLNTTNNTIKVHGLNSFSLFTLTDVDTPLPVELNSFTAAPSGRDINLKWETETEVSSYGFEVERAQSNSDFEFRISNFEKIGFVVGHGNSNSPKQYNFTDNNLNSGKYMYRLKMVDNDGSYEYSPEVESEIDVPKEYLLSQNYPNPFNPTTKIDYQLPFESNVTIELYNITGERVDVLVNQEQAAGYYTVEVSSTQFRLSSGVYIYRMTAVSTKDLKSYAQLKKMVLLK